MTTLPECTHTAGRSDDSIYYLSPRAIAPRREELNEFRDRAFCRRCMVFLAAEKQLDLGQDFVTKAEVDRLEGEEETRRRALEEVVDWVEAAELIPDVRGQSPRLGDQILCRKCVEPFAPDRLIVIDGRFVRWLHPDLSRGSSRPKAVLEKMTFCLDNCWPELQELITKIAGEHDIPLRWEQGRSHHTLQWIFSQSSSRQRQYGS